MHQISGLLRYMTGIEKELGVRIVIKDFIGFLDLEPEIYHLLHPFCVHQSPYCMYVKDREGKWDDCLLAKDKIEKKLDRLLQEDEKGQGFYGYCHAGVGEYVIPITVERPSGESGLQVVGAVTLGGFRSEEKNSLKPLEVRGLYEQFCLDKEYNIDEIEEKAQVITEYLSMLYREKIRMCQLSSHTSESRHAYMVGNAMAYIKLHYKEPITLDQVTGFCHCSHSFMSHKFKSMTGRTMKGYINELRIEAAKEQLKATTAPVTEIGFGLGFKDGNYFSKVFKDITGISPLKYRKEGGL